MSPLGKQNLEIPFAGGLSQRNTEYLIEPPKLLRAENVVFDEPGSFRLRNPFSALSTSILGGGTLANVRRLAVYDDELVAFTKDTIYSWSPATSQWVARDTYLAPAVTETPCCIRPPEQRQPDRAQVGGVTLFTWQESSEGVDTAFYALIDATSGAYLLSPQVFSGNIGADPRCIALDSVFVVIGNNGSNDIYAAIIDPTDIDGTTGANLTEVAVNSGSDAHTSYQYDIVAGNNIAFVAWRRTASTGHGLATVTAAGAVSRATPTRDCVGPIAVAYEPTIDRFYVVRMETSLDVYGDIVQAGFTTDSVDTHIALVTTGGVEQLTVAVESTTTGGQYIAHVFWHDSAIGDETDWFIEQGTIDDAGTAQAGAPTPSGSLLRRHGLASHAFEHDGQVFVWVAFGGLNEVDTLYPQQEGLRARLQNTYLLYRSDGRLIGKAVGTTAGGFAPKAGFLGKPQSLGGNRFGWAAEQRRIIPVGTEGRLYATTNYGNTSQRYKPRTWLSEGYSARSLRDVVLEFDAASARRVAQFGKTLYIAGSQVVQYDGLSAVELGFHTYPWWFSLTFAAAGNMDGGGHTFKWTWASENARGERDRSTTALTGVYVGGSDKMSCDLVPLHTTLKDTVLAELWSTKVNPFPGAPFYLCTSKDPADSSGDNWHALNDPDADTLFPALAFEHNLSDATLETKEINYETAGVLESVVPPSAKLILSTADRLFLAGIAGQPEAVAYSKIRQTGEVAGFHEALTFEVADENRGPITALAPLNDSLVVFKEAAVFVVPGLGFNNDGSGANFGPPQLLSRDLGAVSQESVAWNKDGILFKSKRGWHFLDRGRNIRYVGEPVSDYDSETIVSVDVLEGQHQIRCLSGSRCLVYDTVVDAWSEWTISGTDAVVWQGTYYYCDASGVHEERTDFTGVDYGFDVETAWVKFNGLQGFARLREILALGTYRGAFDLRIRLARDYATDYFQDKTWTVTPVTVGAPIQVEHQVSQQRMSAVKVRLTSQAVGVASASTTEAATMTGLGFSVGIKRGLNRRFSIARKQ